MKRTIAVCLALVFSACGDGASAPECAPDGFTHESGVFYVDLRCGSGDEADGGDRATIEYVGRLEDGTIVDSSADRGEPYRFLIGDADLIEGWAPGITGMHVGGKRRIVIPPELAYGEDGLPPDIPPDATLIFEVTLVSVRP